MTPSSQHSRQTGAAPMERLAVDAGMAAAMFGLGRSTWFKLASAGRLPRPRRLGRRVLYDISELRQWWGAGAPNRNAWDALKAAALKSSVVGLEHGGVRGKVERNTPGNTAR